MELLSALSLIMVHLSRFSEEIILWCSWEFKFIELDDAYSTGSSIMPQKKNPDVAELVRGKSGRVFGDLAALLTMLKGLPLAYNKDMQEDKEAVFDALDTVNLCLTVFAPMVETMKVLPDNMRRAAAGASSTPPTVRITWWARDCPSAMRIRPLASWWLGASNRADLETLSLAEYQEVCPLFDEGVYEVIVLERCAALRRVYGGPAPDNVRPR